jgi:hypothetical protein
VNGAQELLEQIGLAALGGSFVTCRGAHAFGPRAGAQHVGDDQPDRDRDQGVEREQAQQAAGRALLELGLHQRLHDREQDQAGRQRPEQAQHELARDRERSRSIAQRKPAQGAEQHRAHDSQIQRRTMPPRDQPRFTRRSVIHGDRRLSAQPALSKFFSRLAWTL